MASLLVLRGRLVGLWVIQTLPRGGTNGPGVLMGLAGGRLCDRGHHNGAGFLKNLISLTLAKKPDNSEIVAYTKTSVTVAGLVRHIHDNPILAYRF